MQPGQDREHAIVGRISARLQTLIGTGRATADFALLCGEAERRLGPEHETTLLTEYHLEVRRDADRGPAASVPVWESLRERAGKSLPAGTPAELAIRFRHLRRLRCRGRHGDLDLLVGLCREEIGHRAVIPDPHGAGEARTDLALALRDRAWLGGFTGPAARPDPWPDLREAVALIEGEVRRHRESPVPDQPAAVAARRVQVEVLLAAGRADPAAAGRALAIADELVLAEEDVTDLRDPAYDHLTPAHVLLAEALLLAGRTEEAARVARLAYALHAGTRVFDPARPLLALARSEARTDRAGAARTARAALEQRTATFGGDGPYVAEAADLAGALTS
ncbi:hypothetical protein [Actinoplanes utahensis]|uniref:Uncharacterized protein n=1 Tax=Actinoplanes utahensis TaxID=1869 RepID=A0A0A6XBD9_ACTUT|nr:hypothetical protein [Actinoplanes utahensis]KHD77402.1 hypothetical protein MB27_11730 [Actinoplanes utahensis]GIF32832.1 hypothetical protein Aut01nite_58180 [Actinoplanes utahensis]